MFVARVLMAILIIGHSAFGYSAESAVISSSVHNNSIGSKTQQTESSVGAIDDALIERNFLKPFNFNDRQFSQSVILQGLWSPQQFIRNVGYGLYSDGAFVKNKPLLVLVHGINDSPRRWQPLLKKLDHENYQVLRFYYPGGMSIDVTAEVLAKMLQRVLAQSPQSHIVMVGHSMGGLVSRAAIQHLDTLGLASSVKEFFSVATPWGGHELATFGMQQSPIIVPVIRDLATNSEFLKRIYARQWPASVRFSLLYASAGSIEILGEPNDGVVTLRSQLDEQAKRDAVQVKNIQAAHIPSLFDDETVKVINQALFSVAVEDV